jgi:hypothetical protein
MKLKIHTVLYYCNNVHFLNDGRRDTRIFILFFRFQKFVVNIIQIKYIQTAFTCEVKISSIWFVRSFAWNKKLC